MLIQAEQQVKYYNSPVGGDVAITDGSKLYIVTRENSKGIENSLHALFIFLEFFFYYNLLLILLIVFILFYKIHFNADNFEKENL